MHTFQDDEAEVRKIHLDASENIGQPTLTRGMISKLIYTLVGKSRNEITTLGQTIDGGDEKIVILKRGDLEAMIEKNSKKEFGIFCSGKLHSRNGACGKTYIALMQYSSRANRKNWGIDPIRIYGTYMQLDLQRNS